MTGPDKAQLWRYGSLAAFCGLPLLLLGLAIGNLVEASAAGDESAREQTMLSQIVTQVARHRARTLTPADTASLYLESTSASLARAEIQEKVTALVAQSGGRLAETQLVGTPEDEAAGVVAIQLTLSVDNKGLLDLLYQIETGLPLLEVTDLNVSRNDGQGGDMATEDKSGAEAAAALLRVELTVTGRWRKTTG